uniref:Uncharacterized protein n=1 Tax=Oryza brachyantha TaxID=4533 RepID=J3M4M0_ORYBR
SSSAVAAVGRGVHAALGVLDEVVGAREAAGEAEVVGLGGHLGGDVRGDLADVGEGREDEPPREVVLAHLLRQRPRRRQQHVVVDADGAGDHHAQPEPREDVGVVRLPRHVRLPLVLHRVERAPAREHRSYLGPGVRLLCGALRVRRRVGQGEDDGYLVEGGHGLDHLLGEGLADAGGADEHGRLEVLHGLQQRLHGFMLVRPWLLEVLQRLLPRLHDQSPRVHQPHLLAALLDRNL